MLWSVYWHVQQTKTVEGFTGHGSCCWGRINRCAVLTVVVGSVLAVLHLVCSSCAAPASSHGDVLWRGPQNGTPPTTLSARRFIM